MTKTPKRSKTNWKAFFWVSVFPPPQPPFSFFSCPPVNQDDQHLLARGNGLRLLRTIENLFYILLRPARRVSSLFSNTVSVARLGEFSPIGRLFTLGNFVKNTEIAQIIGLLFSTVKAVHYFHKK
jgi:hypothetical protein